MSITANVSDDGNTLTIAIEGRFDASVLDDFRKCYEESESSAASEYVVDFNDTMYLDSSALGMLLVLRDYAGGDEYDIKIINCSDEIKKIFTISNFSQLFDIQ